MVTDWDVFAAVAARIGSQLGQVDAFGNPCVYEYGKVPGENGNPGPMPPVYVLVTAERRYVGARKAGRSAGMSAWRVAARHVGTTAREAMSAGQKVWSALEGERLAVAGEESTPLLFESGATVLPDDGLFSGEAVWTFAI